MSVSLRPYGLQHARLLCSPVSPGACSNSCPLSWWCHPTISSSAVPFSSCPQSFPASGSFPMSWLFTWGDQSFGAPALVLPMNIQGLISFRIDWFDLPGVQGTLKSLFQHHNSKASILRCSAFFMVQPSHPYMTTGKTIALTIQTFVSKVMSLLFKMLSSFSSKEKPSFSFMAAVTICSDFRTWENKISHCLHCFPIYLPWRDGTGCHDLHFLNAEF